MSAEQVAPSIDTPRHVTWEWLCQAVDEIGPPGPGQGFTLHPSPADRRSPTRCSVLALSPRPESARTARHFTRKAAGELVPDGIVDDMAVTVSELVSNALRHGQTSATDLAPQLSLWIACWAHSSRVVCAVTDATDEVIMAPRADEFAESGRGLQVVSALSEMWGWHPRTGGGKVVWALFVA